jgi:hypothetical protein
MTLPTGPSGVGSRAVGCLYNPQMHPILSLDITELFWMHKYSVLMVPCPSGHCSCAIGGRGGKERVWWSAQRATPRGAKVPKHATQAPPGGHMDLLHKHTGCINFKKMLPTRRWTQCDVPAAVMRHCPTHTVCLLVVCHAFLTRGVASLCIRIKACVLDQVT